MLLVCVITKTVCVLYRIGMETGSRLCHPFCNSFVTVILFVSHFLCEFRDQGGQREEK